jgi:hypothetical protein
MKTNDPSSTENLNKDPLTGEPGSHPVATGLGTAAAGATGAVIGTAVGGPIGTIVGTVIGAVAGALGGHALGEKIDPTVEDAYWREAHPRQPYAEGMSYDECREAYRVGYEGPALGSFEEAEPELRARYEAGEKVLPWIKVRVATQSAWTRAMAPKGKAGPSRSTGGVY